MRLSACLAVLVLWLGGAAAPGRGAPPAPARRVRLADVGWTDITATTALTAELLRSAGYDPEIRLLSLPVTFLSLKTADVDVFLGNWMPTQVNDIRPYLREQSIVDLAVNLKGALYTFAVPRYAHDAGVRSAADLAAHREKFRGRIYGIEPGNEGNRLVLDMIRQNTYGLAGWMLVESSEQGMLSEVRQSISRREWIVFLGWRPHPMNTTLSMEYLTDPLQKWGLGGGASEVHTIVSRELVRRSPELTAFFRKLAFTVELENELMGAILDRSQSPEAAARAWMQRHPPAVSAWLEALPAAGQAAQAPPGPDTAAAVHKLPLGAWISRGISYLTAHFSRQLRAASAGLTRALEWIVGCLSAVPPPWMIALMVATTLLIHRSLRLAAAVLVGTAVIWNLGYWQATLQTLALVVTAAAISTLLGVPVGIAAARHPWLYTLIRPVLDMMQTIPTFVYLIPTLMLFGLGIVPGLISTVIFALPAPIRLTYLGVTGVPKDLIEAAQAFGARPLQVLTKVEIPHALPAILEGVTQALMLSLSMVVIAALVGAEGLGTPVVRALNTVNVEQGFEAGLSIVVVAILLDRLVKKQPHPKVRRRFGETGL
ncbi:MAG: choline ABC transporter permease subunit [Candidatus Wallbacteria bacterium]|nr:choline ABC transporter permease subunit [Candidatus Wallbacteria bacterium]